MEEIYDTKERNMENDLDRYRITMGNKRKYLGIILALKWVLGDKRALGD